MPYFKRKPYREMTAAVAPDRPPEEAFADLAHSVLAAETGPRQAIAGPFRVAHPTAPGEEGRMTLSLAADDAGGPLTLELEADDMRGPGAASMIPAGAITIQPETVTAPPGGEADVRVAIRAPRDAASGVYRGRIIGTGTEGLVFLIEIEVAGVVD